MDRTESRVDTPASPKKGSQARIPAILLWLVAAAVALRIVTAYADRGQGAETGGLVPSVQAARP